MRGCNRVAGRQFSLLPSHATHSSLARNHTFYTVAQPQHAEGRGFRVAVELPYDALM